MKTCSAVDVNRVPPPSGWGELSLDATSRMMAIAAAVLFCIGCSEVQPIPDFAAVLQNDFESYPVGDFKGIRHWRCSSDPGVKVEVSEDEADGKCLMLFDDVSSADAAAGRATVSFARVKEAHVRFRLKWAKGNAEEFHQDMGVHLSSGRTGFLNVFANGGHVRYWHGSGWTDFDPPVPLVDGKWYDVSLHVRPSACEAGVNIDGQDYAPVPFRRPAEGMDSLTFVTQRFAQGTLLVDDVSVLGKVPDYLRTRPDPDFTTASGRVAAGEVSATGWFADCGSRAKVDSGGFTIRRTDTFSTVRKCMRLDFSHTPVVSFDFRADPDAEWYVFVSAPGEPPFGRIPIHKPLVGNGRFDCDLRACTGWSGVKPFEMSFAARNGRIEAREIGVSRFAPDFIYPPDNTDVSSLVGPGLVPFTWSHVSPDAEYVVEYWPEGADPSKASRQKSVGRNTAYPVRVLKPGVWHWRVTVSSGRRPPWAGNVWSFRQGRTDSARTRFDPIGLVVGNSLPSERREELVTSGVPFRKGSTWPGANLMLTGDSGNRVSLHTSPLAFWEDGSVKWLLLDFPASVPAGGESTFTLRPGEKNPDEPPAIARLEADAIAVDTGKMKVAIPLSHLAPFEGLDFAHGETASYPVELSVTADGKSYLASRGEAQSWIESNGPVSATILTHGTLAEQTGESEFEYTMRFTFSRGSRRVRVLCTLLCVSDKTEVMLEGATIRMTGVGAKWCALGKDKSMRFDLNGAEIVLDQHSHSKFTIAKLLGETSTQLHEGKRAEGWCLTERVGIGVARFWQQRPKRLRVGSNSLAVELYSSAAKPRRFASGAAKTHELLILLSADELDGGEAACDLASVDWPLQARCSPRYYLSTGAIRDVPPMSPSTAEFDKLFVENLDGGIAERESRRYYGMMQFGDLRILNSEIDIQKAYLLQYVRSGERKYLDFAADMSRHNMDVDVCHFCPKNYRKVGGHYRHCRDHNTGASGIAVPSHTWLEGYLLYYYLTGYRRAFEIASETGRGLVHNATNDGMMHSGADPRGSSGSREFGRVFWNLCALYRATCNPRYVWTMRRIKEGLLAAQRPDGAFPSGCSGYGKWTTADEAPHMASIAAVGLKRYYELTGDETVLEPLERFCKWDVSRGTVPFKLGFQYHNRQGSGSLHLVDACSNMLEVLPFVTGQTGDRRYLDFADGLYDVMLEYDRSWAPRDWTRGNRSVLYYLAQRERIAPSPVPRSSSFDPSRTVRFIRRLQNADGGFGLWEGMPSDAESSCRCVQVLKALNSEQRAAADAVKWLKACRQEGGGYACEPEWQPKTAPTYFCLQALASLGQRPDDPEETLAWITSAQNEEGGFESSPRPERFRGMKRVPYYPTYSPYVTATYFGVAGLGLLDAKPRSAPDCLTWLDRCRAADGGFGEKPGQSPTALVTWLALGSVHQLRPGEIADAATLRFMLDRQNEDGGFSWEKGRRSTMRHTWHCVRALSLMGTSPRQPQRCVEWILSCGNDDGGFGHRPGRSSDALSTYYAVAALRELNAPTAGRTTFRVAHDGCLNPVTSGRWAVSGTLVVEFEGPIDPHENTEAVLFGQDVHSVEGRFEKVGLPDGWLADVEYGPASVKMKRFRPDHAPAFPGAEGFGKYTIGGRGGRVIEVTNLADDGPGSFRAACEAEGPRTIVFRVAGNIELESKLTIRNPYVTIAGQTAPGDGVCVKNHQVSFGTHNLIVRYMRFRPGDVAGREYDGFGGRGHHVIVDHCSVSWGIDETLSIYKSPNVTVQWCMVTESLAMSCHKKGRHGYGGIWGGPGGSFHHNLLAHHTSRNPRMSGDDESGLIDVRNNVIYNWGFNSAYGGEQWGRNWINNYYKYGPASYKGARDRIFIQMDPRGRMYAAGNFVRGFPEITKDNWAGGIDYHHEGEATEKTLRVYTPYTVAPVRTQSALDAYESVLSEAGCSIRRDALDRRIVEEVRSGTAKFGATYEGGGKGIIDSQKDVGGWPKLGSSPAPADGDHDGMPDAWERQHGLNPADPADGSKDRNGDGYTNLEGYLNTLAGD